MKAGKKWGYFNKQGLMVIKAAYDDARPFFEGLARVELEGNDRNGAFMWCPEKE